MGFFRRRVDPQTVRRQQDDAITAFWQWWATEGRPLATAVFDDHADPRPVADAVVPRLSAIHRGLAFETGAGVAARHVLVVTAAGDPTLRDVADRWLAAAPAPDAAFEYDAWRRPVADPDGVAVDLGGGRLALADVRAVLAPRDGLVDVLAWHPAFADLPDEARGQITFLLLDALLGERAVEMHVGAVAWTASEPADARPLLDLRDLLGRPDPTADATS